MSTVYTYSSVSLKNMQINAADDSQMNHRCLRVERRGDYRHTSPHECRKYSTASVAKGFVCPAFCAAVSTDQTDNETYGYMAQWPP